MKATIHDTSTGEVIVRPMTDLEIAQLDKALAESSKLKKIEEDRATARLEILRRLGITEEEAKLLLS